MTAQIPSTPRDSLEEGAPLLSPVDAPKSQSVPPVPSKSKKPWVLLVVLVFLLVAIVDVGALMAEAPKTRVYEANICLSYYKEHDPSKVGADGTVPEKLCKIDKVQQTMATVFGWAETFDNIPGLLLAIPCGMLADKWGRKWLFAASLMGLSFNAAWIMIVCYFQSLPLHLVWFASVFFFLGGGPIVAGAIAMTMLSDIVPADKRTAVFLYLTASVLIAELIAPIVASRLMDKGAWTPLLVALAIQQAGVCLAVFFPETLHLRDLPEPKDSDSERSIELHSKDNHLTFKAQVGHFKDAIMFVKKDWTLTLVILTFLVNRLGRNSLALLIRYASKRYDWEIKQANYLLSFRAATNLIAITVFVPIASFVLLRCFRLAPHWADLWLARVSIIITTFSFFVMGISAHPALLILGLLVFNLGTGYNAAMRSISIHVAGGQSSPDIGKVMSLIAITESIGTMIASPLLNQMFQWGMDMGTAWLGLPFLTSMVVFAAMASLTFMINVQEKEVEYTGVANEEQMESDAERASTSALERDASPRSLP